MQPGNDFSQFWSLDPAFTFLNHGSFGACPIAVLEVQQELRSRLERQPLRFLGREFEALLDQSRQSLAAFVGASVDELVFVPNATTGVNSVLRSLTFSPNDELLTTSQEYNACRNALDFVAARSGATIVVAEIPYPIESPHQVIEAVLSKVTDRTRLALIDQVVSQTGLVFPIAQIVQALSERGIETLIDGAHAPGMLALNLAEIGATYYSATCHKWMCAPKGAAFLYVKKQKQAEIRPLTISHGANSPRRDRSRFHLEFDWMGTTDPTAYLCVPSAIEFMQSLLPGGWTELMQRNRATAIAARNSLCEKLNVAPPCPEAMIGSLATIPLPDGSYLELQDALYEKYNIEVPIVPFPQPPNRLVRISAQLYNTAEQYEYLGNSLLTLIGSKFSQ
ncbi:MAG TPA: aminotransferase class V-fold PLP-dependent enzyme [Leptolyngbya sp.]|jgi:isopenicillin-N epimerase|nr:aminotransferase class V-fold PLP-dependent enzyme [Leptolyngbya sp.]